jgi:hypothetical protein
VELAGIAWIAGAAGRAGTTKVPFGCSPLIRAT